MIIPVNASGRQGNIENITALSVFGNNLFGESMSLKVFDCFRRTEVKTNTGSGISLAIKINTGFCLTLFLKAFQNFINITVKSCLVNTVKCQFHGNYLLWLKKSILQNMLLDAADALERSNNSTVLILMFLPHFLT